MSNANKYRYISPLTSYKYVTSDYRESKCLYDSGLAATKRMNNFWDQRATSDLMKIDKHGSTVTLEQKNRLGDGQSAYSCIKINSNEYKRNVIRFQFQIKNGRPDRYNRYTKKNVIIGFTNFSKPVDGYFHSKAKKNENNSYGYKPRYTSSNSSYNSFNYNFNYNYNNNYNKNNSYKNNSNSRPTRTTSMRSLQDKNKIDYVYSGRDKRKCFEDDDWKDNWKNSYLLSGQTITLDLDLNYNVIRLIAGKTGDQFIGNIFDRIKTGNVDYRFAVYLPDPNDQIKIVRCAVWTDVWQYRRLLWIGYLKNENNPVCPIVKLPKDVLKLVLALL